MLIPIVHDLENIECMRILKRQASENVKVNSVNDDDSFIFVKVIKFGLSENAF